jgi:ketosteroid isomerase-like protein
MRLAIVPVAAMLAATALFPARADVKLDPRLTALADAERSFARTAGERGIKDSFLAWFAEDSIDFEPDPGPAIARIQAWPAPKHRVQLSWEPVFLDLSRDGDMGYTTGPTLVHDLDDDPRPDRHGYYFSVWRKQKNGEWKVALDAGIGVPGIETPPRKLQAAIALGYAKGKAKEASAQRDAILALEREPGADARHAAEETRLHRDGVYPILGRSEVLADLARRAGPTHFEPAEAVVSASVDLAYSYGSFTRGQGANGERGYYAHVWKRAPSGKWSIVAQIEQAGE